MSLWSSWRVALSLLTLFAVSVWAPADAADPKDVAAWEAEFNRAQGLGAVLAVADKFHAAGLGGRAKQIVDYAAGKAATAQDWRSIATAYRRLGFDDAAREAAARAAALAR